MGCSLCREKDANNAEDLIRLKLGEFGFAHLKSSEISICFHNFSKNNALTTECLQSALAELFPKYTPNDKKKLFYNKFKTDEGLFCARKLTTIGILLCKDQTSLKVESMVENYDTDHLNSMTSEKMKLMIEEILEIALITIPKIVSEIVTHKEEKEILHAYCQKVGKTFEYIQKSYNEEFVKNENMNKDCKELEKELEKSEFLIPLVSQLEIRLLALKKFQR